MRVPAAGGEAGAGTAERESDGGSGENSRGGRDGRDRLTGTADASVTFKVSKESQGFSAMLHGHCGAPRSFSRTPSVCWIHLPSSAGPPTLANVSAALPSLIRSAVPDASIAPSMRLYSVARVSSWSAESSRRRLRSPEQIPRRGETRCEARVAAEAVSSEVVRKRISRPEGVVR